MESSLIACMRVSVDAMKQQQCLQWSQCRMLFIVWQCSLQRQRFYGPCSVPRFRDFLMRGTNRAFTAVTGEMVSEKLAIDYIEVPCVFRLYGPKAYIDKIKKLVEALFVDGLLLLTRNTRTHTVFGRRGFRLSVRGGN